jgi:hypothetical protein
MCGAKQLDTTIVPFSVFLEETPQRVRLSSILCQSVSVGNLLTLFS